MNECCELYRLIIADVVDTVSRPTGACQLLASRWSFHNADHSFHHIVNKCEIAPHLSIVVGLNRRTLDNCFTEFKQGHIGPSPRTIHRKKPKSRYRQVI